MCLVSAKVTSFLHTYKFIVQKMMVISVFYGKMATKAKGIGKPMPFLSMSG